MTSPSVVHAKSVPVIPGYYSGVGDLFSALLLGSYHADSSAHLHEMETPLSYATSQALVKTHTILRQTYEYTQSLPEEECQSTDDEKDASEPYRRIRRMRAREIRLVQSQDLLKDTKLDDMRRLEPWVGFWVEA
jgi:pyridoxine kinase